MAQRKVVVIEDDIDGSEGAETVQFALDGTNFEIDLSDKHAKALRKALAPYVAAARKTKKPARKRERVDASAIREWARDSGYEVPARGRIPREIREAYEAA